MANYRQSTNSSLFRILVTPAVLLCVIFRKPIFQWIAVAAIAIWLLIQLILALKRSGKRRKQKRSEKKLRKKGRARPARVESLILFCLLHQSMGFLLGVKH